jgi:hypothetical protein
MKKRKINKDIIYGIVGMLSILTIEVLLFLYYIGVFR